MSDKQIDMSKNIDNRTRHKYATRKKGKKIAYRITAAIIVIVILVLYIRWEMSQVL